MRQRAIITRIGQPKKRVKTIFKRTEKQAKDKRKFGRDHLDAKIREARETVLKITDKEQFILAIVAMDSLQIARKAAFGQRLLNRGRASAKLRETMTTKFDRFGLPVKELW